jgi:hypothetical protein
MALPVLIALAIYVQRARVNWPRWPDDAQD